MGYRKPQTVYLLQFEDRDGLEVRAASVPMGRLLDVAEMADRLRSGEAKAFGEARELFALFGSCLRSWNLEEEDGTPIPADTEHVLEQEFSFITEILLAWFDAIASVPDPLAGRSTNGSQSGVPNIPMEEWSVSLPN